MDAVLLVDQSRETELNQLLDGRIRLCWRCCCKASRRYPSGQQDARPQSDMNTQQEVITLTSEGVIIPVLVFSPDGIYYDRDFGWPTGEARWLDIPVWFLHLVLL